MAQCYQASLCGSMLFIKHQYAIHMPQYYQGRIKRRGHATPNTLPIDIEILDVTKKDTLGAHVNIHLEVSTRVYEMCYSAT